MADPPGTTSAQQTCLACILCLETVTPGIGLCLSSQFSVSWAQIWTRLYFWNIYVLWPSSFLHSHRPCSSQESFPAKAFFQPACFSSLECNPGDNIFHARGETILERASSRQGLFPATSLFQAGTFSSPVQFPASLRSPHPPRAGFLGHLAAPPVFGSTNVCIRWMSIGFKAKLYIDCINSTYN